LQVAIVWDKQAELVVLKKIILLTLLPDTATQR